MLSEKRENSPYQNNASLGVVGLLLDAEFLRPSFRSALISQSGEREEDTRFDMDSVHGRICIAASAQRLDVDNRISLPFYYRIAGNLLKQANIYRNEKNIIDLYIMLLRFSSLIGETIPQHQDYNSCLSYERNSYKEKLFNIVTELEILKPKVQRILEEINRKSRNQLNVDLEWPQKPKIHANYHKKQDISPQPRNTMQKIPSNGRAFYKASQNYKHKPSQYLNSEEQFRRMSLGMPRPNEETLSKHSILGPNGLYGQWRPSAVNTRIQYPSNLDLSPAPMSITQELIQEKTPAEEKKDFTAVEVDTLKEDILSLLVEDHPAEEFMKADIVRQPSPPPVLADVQNLVMDISIPGEVELLPDELIRAKSPLEVHVSADLMESFLRVAKSNTRRALETCGVLAGSLKNKKFYVTTLIIPKQESTSNTCHTTNEEEIFEYQDKESLFPLGWIHTHPTQSCFMSSVDLHTHYSYQIMLPEAIAIVMAPTDSASPYGIFRLTSPGGMKVIRNCQQRGFHSHEQPPDGGPIYRRSSDVRLDPSLKFDVVDLR